MTTTLRPAGPEERGEEGSRSRAYTVCVNGRPVGRMQARNDGRFGPSFGEITGLEIDEADRGRGRATVAALAGEELLRSWGCTHAELTVPSGAEPALRLTAALGYRESSRTMAKDLVAEPPAPPHGSVARPLGGEEALSWLARGRETFIASLTGIGVPRERAAARQAEAVAGMMVGGRPAPGTALLGLDHEGVPAGFLWLRTEEPAWVFYVEVDPAQRGRGHGRTLMTAAERACREVRGAVLGLNVFSANSTAARLYESLGYRTVTHSFVKPLL